MSHDREANLFDLPSHICYCVPNGMSACAPCRDRKKLHWSGIMHTSVTGMIEALPLPPAPILKSMRELFTDAVKTSRKREKPFTVWDYNDDRIEQLPSSYYDWWGASHPKGRTPGEVLHRHMRDVHTTTNQRVIHIPREPGDPCSMLTCRGLVQALSEDGEKCSCSAVTHPPCPNCEDNTLECDTCRTQFRDGKWCA